MKQEHSQLPASPSETPSPHVARLLVLGKLTSSIAHEVNEPLTAINAEAAACLSWLSAEPPNLVEARRALLAIQEGVTRASATLEQVRRMLAPASIEPREPCELDDIARGLVPIVRAQFMYERVELNIELAAAGARVGLDPVELQQVLLQLLINAAEACEAAPKERRRVVLRSAVEPSDDRHRLVVCVEDSGPGLQHLDRPRLFEPLYTTKAHGLGMGLAICRSIIERHAGRLWASDNPEYGASFRFSLPVVVR